MLAAVVTVLVATGLGAAFGLSRRGGVVLGATHTFAVVAALVVILIDLLPESLSGLGLWALVVFAAAFAAAGTLERLAHRKGLEPGWGIELGFLGLVAHRVGDGLAMAHFGTAPAGPQWSGMLALAAHEVPVIALVVIAYRQRSRRAALWRAALLALAAVVGVVLHGALPTLQDASAWIAALLAGLLLHVVTHGWETPRPTTTWARAVDVAAVIGGALLVLFVRHEHGPSAGAINGSSHPSHAHAPSDRLSHDAEALATGVRDETLETLGRLTLQIAPLFLAAMVLALIAGFVTTAVQRSTAPRVVRLLHQPWVLRWQRARQITRPRGVGVEGFLLAVFFFGWRIAAVVAGAALLARTVGVMALGSWEPVVAEAPSLPAAPSEGWLTRASAHVQSVLPWLALGLLAAAYVEVVLPDGALTALPATFAAAAAAAAAHASSTDGAGASLPWLSIAVALPAAVILCAPTYLSAVALVPFGAILMSKGLGAGAVVAGLVIGTQVSYAGHRDVACRFGDRAARRRTALIAVAAFVSGLAVEMFFALRKDLSAEALRFAWTSGTSATPASFTDVRVGSVAVCIVILLALGGIWSAGLRGWIKPLFVAGPTTGETRVRPVHRPHEQGHRSGHSH